MAWSIQWSVAMVVFLLVMAGAGYYVFMEALSGGQYVTVPNISNLPITEASLLLTKQGLDLGRQEQVPHPTIPKYYVIAQRPEAGRVVRMGRKVYPTVSMGTQFLTTPNLINKPLNDARQDITESRFRLGTVARIPHKSPRDSVIAQDPPPGGNIPNEGAINLLISAGTDRRSAFMPDIRGKNMQEIANALTPYAVVLIPNIVDIPGALEDVALNQDPPPDTLIYEGQVVTYDVKPSGAVALPDARQQAEVRHVLDYDWYDKDVRVEVIDRGGNRKVVWSKPPVFDDQSRLTYVAGSAIRIPITYIGELTVEIYINNTLVESYFLSEGKAPVKGSERAKPAVV